MRVIRSLLIALLIPGLLLFGSPAFSDASKNLAQLVFERSGMHKQIEQIPDAIRDGFDEAVASGDYPGYLPDHLLADLREGLGSAFNSADLAGSVTGVLDESLSADLLREVLDWHESQLGRKIIQAELDNSTFAEPAIREAFLEELLANPENSERIGALEGLEKAWRTSDTSVDMMIGMQVAVATAMVQLMPVEERPSVKQIVGAFKAQRPALQRHFANETLLSMIFIYRDLSIAEIEHYTGFARSVTGELYVDATNQALHRSMLAASLRFGEIMGKLIQHNEAHLDI